jgi:hypothetical protein
VGAAGSARLADAFGDSAPYLLLAGICIVTLGGLGRQAVRLTGR